MKLLLLLLIVLLAAWFWRSARTRGKDEPEETAHSSKATTAATQPQEMASCQLCQVHLPRADAIVGKRGIYCCTDHRERAESAPP